MFKRTWGYFLLTMLVLTGLAGRLHSDTLSNKERGQIINNLVATNVVLSESIQDLTIKQLNFKPAHKLSIRENVYHLVIIENNIWDMAKAALQQYSVKENNFKRDDKIVITSLEMPETYTDQLYLLHKKRFQSVGEALKQLKQQRKEISTYIKTTTDDIHSHTVLTPLGKLDIYQLMLVSLTCTDYYINQIESIKSDPQFPKS